MINPKMAIMKNKEYAFIDRLIFLLLSSYFILYPFYLWSSGLPQIADLFMVLLFNLCIYKNKGVFNYSIQQDNLIITNLLFVFYIVFINLLWVLILGQISSFINVSFYYIYNYFIVSTLLLLYNNYGKKIQYLIYNSISISVGLQTIMFLINGNFTGKRMVGSFNNPNQLGYYSLLTISILIVLSNQIEVNSYWFIVIYVSNILLTVASLSSTTIFSYLLVTVLYLLVRDNNKKIKKNMIITLIIIGLILIVIKVRTDYFETSLMIEGLRTRSRTIESKTTNIVTQRGYDRIISYPEYWLFGAGEGGYLERFGVHMEFHSLLGNIQVSYGIIGSFLFINLLRISIKSNYLKNLSILIPVLFYGITHNGIRSGLFWVLLCILMFENEIKY